MPRRAFGSTPDLDKLRLALLEQEQNERPGRVPSGIATNDFLGSIPRTFEQEREAGTLAEMDRRVLQSLEDDRARRGKLEDAKGAASIRDFERRTGRGRFTPVGAEQDEDLPPPEFTAANFPPVASHAPAFTPENFRPVASHAQPPAPQSVRTIRRAKPDATQPGARFSDSNAAFTDPDAAMGARDRARLDPRVLSEEVRTAGDVAIASAKAKTGVGQQSPFAQERAVRNLQSVQELKDRVGLFTVGAGSLLDNLPATDARDFSAELNTLKANIAFGELTAMREASKTGGALGQVSNIELKLLESALGALDTRQSPGNFRRQLDKIEASIERWNAAVAGGRAETAPSASDPYEAYLQRRGDK